MKIKQIAQRGVPYVRHKQVEKRGVCELLLRRKTVERYTDRLGEAVVEWSQRINHSRTLNFN
jgi:hypothetical protein